MTRRIYTVPGLAAQQRFGACEIARMARVRFTQHGGPGRGDASVVARSRAISAHPRATGCPGIADRLSGRLSGLTCGHGPRTAAIPGSGVLPQPGLDRHFCDRARALGKRIPPLQSVAEHVAVFARISPALSRDQLAVTLYNAADPATRRKRSIATGAPAVCLGSRG